MWSECVRRGEECDVEVYVGDLRWGVEWFGSEVEVGELQRSGDDDGVVACWGVGGRGGDSFERVGAVFLSCDRRYARIELDVSTRGFQHTVKDLPIATFNMHCSVCSHADHCLKAMYLSDILSVIDSRTRLYNVRRERTAGDIDPVLTQILLPREGGGFSQI